VVVVAATTETVNGMFFRDPARKKASAWRALLVVGALVTAMVLCGASAAQGATAWSGGLTSGIGTSTTTVVSDGTTSPPEFTYNLDNGSAGASGSWQFSTTSTASGPVDLDWSYSGFNAYFEVTVGLSAFVTHNGTTTTTTLVNAGPVDCCTPPSGGFSYSGVTQLTVAAGDTYGFTMAGSNADSDALLSGTLDVTIDPPPTTAGLLGSWTMNETSGTVAADASGHGNDGVISPSVALGVPGASGAAFGFSGGSGSLVDVPYGTGGLEPPTTQLTLSAWIDPSDLNCAGFGQCAIASNEAPPGSGTYGYGIRVIQNPGPQLQFCYGGQNAPGNCVYGAYTPALGTWANVVGTYDGTTLNEYVNGALIASQPGSFPPLNTMSDFFIGQLPSGDNPFDGAIQDVRVYDRVLSPAEIANQAAPDASPAFTSAGTATFVAGQAGSFTITATGSPTAALAETGPLPPGVTFEDTGDGIATLSGAPTAAGSYPVVIGAANGVAPAASQLFDLEVTAAPNPVTAAPPLVSAEGVQTVNGTSATLTAAIDPNGSDTSYVLEYGPTAAYGQETAPVDIGSGTQTVSASISGLAESQTYHFRFVATSAQGTTDGADAMVTTTTGGTGPTLGTVPAPTQTTTADVLPYAGTVLVNGKPLLVGEQIPFGQQIDATQGTLVVRTVLDGVQQAMQFAGGVFVLTQTQAGTTVLTLEGGRFGVCSASRTVRSASSPKTRAVRSLWGNGHGRFEVKGRYAAATVRGTIFHVVDRCDGTLVHVDRGIVLVTVLTTGTTATVTAGRSYLAHARP
jgi:hypothetical protein